MDTTNGDVSVIGAANIANVDPGELSKLEIECAKNENGNGKSDSSLKYMSLSSDYDSSCPHGGNGNRVRNLDLLDKNNNGHQEFLRRNSEIDIEDYNGNPNGYAEVAETASATSLLHHQGNIASTTTTPTTAAMSIAKMLQASPANKCSSKMTTDSTDQILSKTEEQLLVEDDLKENFCSHLEGPRKCDIVNQETFLVDVIVTNAVSPLNFSIQSYRESNILKNLEAQMTTWYNAYDKEAVPHPQLQFKDLSLDAYYALKYRIERTGSESWVRCQIKKPFGESLPILTHLVDHGCYYSTEPKCIRPLRKQYCKLPCQSFDAKLHFIESTKSSFTPEDCHRFHKQVEGKAFCAIVLKNFPTSKDNKLTLVLVDTSTEKDHYIHHDYIQGRNSTGRK